MWIVPFVGWLEMRWPPAVVEASIIKVLQTVGVAKLSPDTRAKFMRYTTHSLPFHTYGFTKRMVKKIRESVDFADCGIPIIERFEASVLWLEVAFAAITGS